MKDYIEIYEKGQEKLKKDFDMYEYVNNMRSIKKMEKMMTEIYK